MGFRHFYICIQNKKTYNVFKYEKQQLKVYKSNIFNIFLILIKYLKIR